MTRSILTKAAIAATFVVVAPVAVQAQNTVLNINGAVEVRDPEGGSGETLLIDFLASGGGFGTVDVTDTPGTDNDLVGVIPGTTQGQIADLLANAGGLETTPSPFLSIGGYTFELATVSDGNTFGPISLNQIDLGGGSVATIASFGATGTVTGPGFTGTRRFTASFTSQFNQSASSLVTAIETGGTVDNAFSATFNLSAVPEPSTYALMASGVAMLGAFARRRKQQA